MNVEIPRLLKSFNLPDTVETRLSCYNWGIGNIKKAYEKYGDDWQDALPQETKGYLMKYNKLIGSKYHKMSLCL